MTRHTAEVDQLQGCGADKNAHVRQCGRDQGEKAIRKPSGWVRSAIMSRLTAGVVNIAAHTDRLYAIDNEGEWIVPRCCGKKGGRRIASMSGFNCLWEGMQAERA